jgi:hypothetical protein
MLCPHGYTQTTRFRNDIRLSVTLEKDAIHVAFNNVGGNVLLVNIGGIVQPYTFPMVHLSAGNGCKQHGRLSDASHGGVIGARGDPWVIIMPPGSTYSLRFSTRALVLAHGERLENVIQPGCSITADFEGVPGVDYAGGRRIPFSITQNGPTMIPFWIGRVESTATY